MDPKKITELANLLRDNGDKILNSEFTLTLSGCLLRALNDSFTLIADKAEIGAPQTFQVVKPINSKSPVFRDLQLIYDFVQKTALLCIVHYPTDDYFEGTIDISKFRALKRLEVQKTNIQQIIGIQPLRSQLQQLICTKSLRNVDEVITHCGGDNSNGFVWNELKVADFSYNNLQKVDSSLEFAQFLQHLNLRHNQLRSVEAIKWLPHLKTLDLSFNCLQCIPQFHMEACRRLQSLNMSNNFVEDLMGISKLDALTDLDLSDNCLLDHSNLLPLSALITLKYLNLYGNPLHCHPKHRLATAQFLHKNTSTVKFILDFEPLSKNEKAITGTQKMRHANYVSRYTMRSTSTSISSGHQTPNSQTPASSVGSIQSFQLHDTTAESEMPTALEAATSTKKRTSKIRSVEIEDTEETQPLANDDKVDEADLTSSKQMKPTDALTKSLIEEESQSEHLEAKKHIETLRKKYGSNWLQSDNAEMMNSMLGIESGSETKNLNTERNISRQLFNDYVGDLSSTPTTLDNTSTVRSSTPTDDSLLNVSRNTEAFESPIKGAQQGDETSLFKSLDSGSVVETTTTTTSESTIYKSVDSSGLKLLDSKEEGDENEEEKKNEEQKQEDDDDDDTAPHLKNVYSTVESEEPEVSEPEDDEETYIVYTTNRNEAIFLTISSNFLREKDTLTQRTKTKWSLKILESCDRIKSNTLRINFDTVKEDKKERIYTVEDGLCQELEKKLRDILSQRDLAEMNQTIYRCVNCTCQFSRENKYTPRRKGICCPDCKSTFVAEIHDIPKSLEKSSSAIMNVSPATVVEPTPAFGSSSAFASTSTTMTSSIGPRTMSAIENATAADTNSIGSANSLNESSSCSKISNSQSSFDSNQSVVGSTNTDRNLDFKSNGESSDVDILSNPSQSSIEVLDQTQYPSRKTSEERRAFETATNMERMHDDPDQSQSYIGRELSEGSVKERLDHSTNTTITTTPTTTPTKHDSSNEKTRESVALTTAAANTTSTTAGPAKNTPLAQFNLTESSSSGSVTDSICTAYEQQADKIIVPDDTKKQATQNLLNEEKSHQTKDNKSLLKKEDSGISSMFGALFQSTNILMSSSKKLIDSEASANLQTSVDECSPFKFNYTDFNDVDHRLKLFFYQTKFEEKGEHFKWIVRGRIYNENVQNLCDGIVVMSTCKCYVMEAYGPEQDDVSKWLRQVVSVTVDRLECIQLLPWKIGLSFTLKNWGGFLLLLQDILRTDSLMLYFANNSLPSQCELKYQPAEVITQRLNSVSVDEKLKICTLLNGCEIICGPAKRSFNVCGLLTTDSHLYLTSSKLNWLSVPNGEDTINEVDIEICITQLMSNLVEVERSTENIFILHYHDETQDQSASWQCTFETREAADSCLNAIGQSWEQLFGVSLFNA